MFSSWDGPVGQAVQEVTDEIEWLARLAAPVSPVGSKFSPPGTLKVLTRTSVEHHYTDDGHVFGLIGAPVYPFAFISNFRSGKGFTWNARSGKHPGRRSFRKADDNYLQRAIDAAPEIVIGQP